MIIITTTTILITTLAVTLTLILSRTLTSTITIGGIVMYCCLGLRILLSSPLYYYCYFSYLLSAILVSIYTVLVQGALLRLPSSDTRPPR